MEQSAAGKIAVVTGGNRGMGFETCRQLAGRGARVILTSREPAKGEAAAGRLQGEGLDVRHHQLDVADDDSIGASPSSSGANSAGSTSWSTMRASCAARTSRANGRCAPSRRRRPACARCWRPT